MRGTRRLGSSAIVVGLLASGLVAVGALTGPSREAPVATTSPTPADPLGRSIVLAQQRLERVPGDSRAWAALSLDYLERARTTGDPSWYAKADGAAARSLRIDPDGNDAGLAARAALATARHDFRGALSAADEGLRANPYSAALLGVQADALTQLGRYDEAAATVTRLNRIRPGVPAFTRASYVLELRGDVQGARLALGRALGDAVDPSAVGYVRGLLAELELRYGGSPARAMEHLDAGLAAAPGDVLLESARARALVALGRDEEAVTAYRDVVAAAPQPAVVLELAELLQSTGRPGAQEQLALFRAQVALQEASGQRLDVEQVLFEADHGSPARAVALAAQAWRTRPFLDTADAYAWALHRAGRPSEALVWSDRALAEGRRQALPLYHRAMVELALGDRDGARQHLEEALRLEPRFSSLHAPRARAALARLR